VLSTLAESTLGVVTVTFEVESPVSPVVSVLLEGVVQAIAVIKTTKKTKNCFIVFKKFF
jgi:hypothetical protein